jgi:hypothetical protein
LGDCVVLTKKKVLGFKVPPRLEQVGANIPSACKTANIAQNDAMILPHDANPGRMEFSERTAMSDECVVDVHNWVDEEQVSSPGKVSLRGEVTGRYCWDGLCVGFVEFCTNGPQGGDAGYGGFLRITWTNSASTCMEVAVNRAEPKTADSVSITFRGDAEISAAIESLEFLAAKLKSIREVIS